MIDQSVIRKKIQAQRAALDKHQQRIFSLEICHSLLQSQCLSKDSHIAIYLPVRGEADPGFLVKSADLSSATFYLPVLSATKKNHLEFALYNKDTPMKLNRFNIPEPDASKAHLIEDVRELDTVIMPMVAIDRMGNRIGMGGGFYDRTFEYRKSEKRSPKLVAFAYDFQLINIQQPQDWDVPADYVALQQNFFRAE